VIGVVDDITTAAAAAGWDEIEEDDTWFSFDGTNNDDNDKEEDHDSVSTAPKATTFAHFEEMYLLAFDNVEARILFFDLPVIPIYHSGVHEIMDDHDDANGDDHSLTTSSDSVLMFDDSEASDNDDDDDHKEKNFVDILVLAGQLKLDWNYAISNASNRPSCNKHGICGNCLIRLVGRDGLVGS
jgi:hypothetical protein